MQDEEIIWVTFSPTYEVKAKQTAQLADIPIPIATSQEERLPDLADEYLQHLPEHLNDATYCRLVGHLWCNLELLQKVGENGLNQGEKSVRVEWIPPPHQNP